MGVTFPAPSVAICPEPFVIARIHHRYYFHSVRLLAFIQHRLDVRRDVAMLRVACLSRSTACTTAL